MPSTEQQKQASKRWYEKNKLLISEKRRGTRQEEHKNSYKNRLEKYGREAINKERRLYVSNNRDHVNKKLREYRQKNQERYLFNRSKLRAKEKKLEFNIELSDVIIPDFCPYLGVRIKKEDNSFDYVPSIDRIDNSKGYIKGNIEVISLKANQMKNRATKQELIAFAKAILSRDIGT